MEFAASWGCPAYELSPGFTCSNKQRFAPWLVRSIVEPHTQSSSWFHERIHVYLGEHLDAFVTDLEELELPVEPEDVHTSPRAASVEDHGVPPRPRL